MKEELMKELQKRLQRLEELKADWERLGINDKYLEGRIEELAEIIDLMHQLEQK